jgi:gliding motility associated protien GldN
MSNKKGVVFSLAMLLVCTGINAQPPRRQQEQQEQKSATAVTLSERAKSQYTGQTGTPTEVAWKRDIYRELDLKKEKNAALYYPEEPIGDRVNFFTLIFNLILDGKIKAYEYRLDGNESFTADNVLDIENMLDKFYIYYEKNDGKYKVAQADIPSGEIMKYYIKESNYLDRRTSDYQTRVTAICPVMIRNDFGTESTQYPMFWLNYDEISPYLGQALVMTSSFNNTTNMSLDDYFVMHQYEGDIYKTSNLRNQAIAEYCENDTLIKMEQQLIEKQLIDFEKNLWGTEDEKKSISESMNKDSKKSEKESVKSLKTERAPKIEKSPKAEKMPKEAQARVSVRRGNQ